ncbi:MAG TPA: hypothetical protein VLC09_04105, partial [Polyangiaceae bacterium]|nr:hypothetical protein [Polyangiaceae bacterium]
PWQESQTPRKAERKEYQSGNQKFELVGDTIVVTMADGGKVTFNADGSVTFKTFDGKQTVKM